MYEEPQSHEELAMWQGEINTKLDTLLKQHERMLAIIEGNGKEGLVVRVDRNTQDLTRLGKLLWIVLTAMLGAIAATLL